MERVLAAGDGSPREFSRLVEPALITGPDTVSSQESLALRKEVLLAANRRREDREGEPYPGEASSLGCGGRPGVRSRRRTALVVLRALPAELASETLAEMEEDERAADLLAAMTPQPGRESS